MQAGNAGEMELGAEATMLVQRQQDLGLKKVPSEFSNSEFLTTLFEQNPTHFTVTVVIVFTRVCVMS